MLGQARAWYNLKYNAAVWSIVLLAQPCSPTSQDRQMEQACKYVRNRYSQLRSACRVLYQLENCHEKFSLFALQVAQEIIRLFQLCLQTDRAQVYTNCQVWQRKSAILFLDRGIFF